MALAVIPWGTSLVTITSYNVVCKLISKTRKLEIITQKLETLQKVGYNGDNGKKVYVLMFTKSMFYIMITLICENMK